MIAGANTEDGVVFRPAEAITKAEAAVMLQNILELPTRDAEPVFAATEDDMIPVWAAEAYHALQDAGIELSSTGQDDVLTRRDAACTLYYTQSLLEQGSASQLFWLE